MELLTIQHTDFTMSIECGKFDAIWTKAQNNIGEQTLYSTYSWTEGVVSVTLNTEDGERQIEKGETAPAVFFDNADYPIWVEFADYVKDSQFGAELQGDNERFTFRRHILAGYLNYGNEIGKSEIHLIYETKEGTKRFTFSFEVLSTKLDYHEHWRSIIENYPGTPSHSAYFMIRIRKPSDTDAELKKSLFNVRDIPNKYWGNERMAFMLVKLNCLENIVG